MIQVYMGCNVIVRVYNYYLWSDTRNKSTYPVYKGIILNSQNTVTIFIIIIICVVVPGIIYNRYFMRT